MDRNNNWILPFISGLIILISLFTPIAFNWLIPFNPEWQSFIDFIWLWGVRHSPHDFPYFTQFPIFPLWLSITAIIISISILIIGICFIINAFKLKKHNINSRKSEKNGFILAILLVVLTIMWMLFFIDLWQSYSIGPSIIGLFFSAAIPFVKKGFQRPSLKLIRVLLLLGGVIVLVSLFTPAMVHYEREADMIFNLHITYEWLWMFGLTFFNRTIYSFYDDWTRTYFYLNLEIVYNCIQCSILIIIMGSLSLIIAVKYKIFQNRWEKIWLIQLTMAITILIAATLWIIIADFIIGYSGLSMGGGGVRSLPILGFGIIGPYIGASLIMLSALFNKTLRNGFKKRVNKLNRSPESSLRTPPHELLRTKSLNTKSTKFFYIKQIKF